MRPLLTFLLAGLLLACNPRPGTPLTDGNPDPNRSLSFMEKAEQEALRSPFIGVTAGTDTATNLFPIRSTGISTAPIVEAAEAFLQTLSPEQKAKTQFPVDHEEWRRWSNVDNGIYARFGTSFKEMSAAQQETAYALLSASLSAKGLQLSKDIMKTDQTLREMNNDNPIFDEELYFFTLMGTPSTTEP